MTKKEVLLSKKVDVLTIYLEFCTRKNEVPQQGIVDQIKKCNTVKGLDEIAVVILME